jgi:hypothetical protein
VAMTLSLVLGRNGLGSFVYCSSRPFLKVHSLEALSLEVPSLAASSPQAPSL